MIKNEHQIKILLIVLLIISLPLILFQISQIQKVKQHAATALGQYQKLELTYPYSGNYSNPYDPSVVDIEANFHTPSGKTLTIPGFFFQDYTRSGNIHKEILSPTGSPQWKVRFAPSELGNYTYTVTLKDNSGTKNLDSGTFTVVSSGAPGFVKAVNYHLEFGNGQLFIPLGLNAPWFQNNTASNKWGDGTYGVDAMYAAYNTNGANTFHLWTCGWNDGNATPFAGPDIACDTNAVTATQMSQPYSWDMDYIISQAELKNIYVIPILKHKDQPNFDPGDALYIRYAIARWGYSTHLLAWDTFKEGAYKLPTVTQYVTTLHNLDPYNHLISASEGDHASANNHGTFYGVMSLPQISLVQNHDYSNDCNQPYDNDTGLYALHVILSVSIRQLTKPSFFGESGMHQCGPDGKSDIPLTISQYVPLDTQARILRGQIWGEFLSSAGGISVWNQMNIANLTAFKGLSVFIQQIPNAQAIDQTVPFSSYDTPNEVTTSDQKIQVIGRKSPTFAMIRVYNTTGTWAAILRDHQTPVPTSGSITLAHMQNGQSFTILWMDPVTGALLTTVSTTSSANGLTLPLPKAVTEDIVAMIINGSIPEPTPSPTLGTTTTPLPSTTSTPSPTQSNFCGQACQTNADCGQKTIACGICDPNQNICVEGISPTTTVSPSPSAVISVTPSPSLGITTGSLSIHFEGIDSQNNPHPHHPQRKLILSFYKTQNFSQNADATVNTTVSFSPSDPNGSFINNQIDLSSIPQGSYYVLAKSPEGSLRELLSPQPITISSGQVNSLSAITQNPMTLPLGDLNNDNSVDLTDYNILVDCYGTKATTSTCTAHNLSDQIKGLFADINDDGEVNGIDYNILLRNLSVNGL